MYYTIWITCVLAYKVYRKTSNLLTEKAWCHYHISLCVLNQKNVAATWEIKAKNIIEQLTYITLG